MLNKLNEFSAGTGPGRHCVRPQSDEQEAPCTAATAITLNVWMISRAKGSEWWKTAVKWQREHSPFKRKCGLKTWAVKSLAPVADADDLCSLNFQHYHFRNQIGLGLGQFFSNVTPCKKKVREKRNLFVPVHLFYNNESWQNKGYLAEWGQEEMGRQS